MDLLFGLPIYHDPPSLGIQCLGLLLMFCGWLSINMQRPGR